MRDNFFKYILLNGSSQTSSELESDTSPFVFKGNGKRLKNYRIYGAEGGVGDLVTDTEDEHYGKYVIPVKIEGKNKLQSNFTSKTYENFTATVNEDKTITLNGTPTINVFITINSYFVAGENDILSGCPAGGASGTYSLRLRDPITDNSYYDYGNGKAIAGKTGTIEMRIRANNTFDNLVFCPMVRDATTDNTYEPYRTPCAINIYLDSPLGAGEYIDFRNQKNNNEDIVLMPALTSVDGTNVLYVGTTVQPAKIYLQGGIEEMPVSLQMSPLNLRSLQTMIDDSIDDNFDDVMPIDTPNLQLNDVGDDENTE